jgi:hypothetical protein
LVAPGGDVLDDDLRATGGTWLALRGGVASSEEAEGGVAVSERDHAGDVAMLVGKPAPNKSRNDA